VLGVEGVEVLAVQVPVEMFLVVVVMVATP